MVVAAELTAGRSGVFSPPGWLIPPEGREWTFPHQCVRGGREGR